MRGPRDVIADALRQGFDVEASFEHDATATLDALTAAGYAVVPSHFVANARTVGDRMASTGGTQMGREHTYCLNCGGSIGQHDPDDMDGCGLWSPSTLKDAKDA